MICQAQACPHVNSAEGNTFVQKVVRDIKGNKLYEAYSSISLRGVELAPSNGGKRGRGREAVSARGATGSGVRFAWWDVFHREPSETNGIKDSQQRVLVKGGIERR